jgi:hypothetical protein
MDYTKWTTNNNEVLDIKDMTDKHIQNCIKMIKRSKWLDAMERYDTVPEPPPKYVVNYELYAPYLKVFKKELDNRLLNA